MLETFIIIFALGGLEILLWVLHKHSEEVDRQLQQKQLQILEDILTELTISNTED